MCKTAKIKLPSPIILQVICVKLHLVLCFCRQTSKGLSVEAQLQTCGSVMPGGFSLSLISLWGHRQLHCTIDLQLLTHGQSVRRESSRGRLLGTPYRSKYCWQTIAAAMTVEWTTDCMAIEVSVAIFDELLHAPVIAWRIDASKRVSAISVCCAF